MTNSLPINHSNLVMPCYEGQSIANIPATIAVLLGVSPLPGLPPLEQSLWNHCASARRVVVLVLDAVGYNTFAQHEDFQRIMPGQVRAITSVFPSTTVAALASLWTGRAPSQHGLLGTRMWLRDYGVLAQMIGLKVARAGYPDQLVSMGFDPKIFLPVPNLPEHLGVAGVSTHDFIPYHLRNTGLTQLLHRGITHTHLVFNLSDAVRKLRDLLESTAGQPLYAHLYHGDMDTMSHFDGPQTTSVETDLGVVAYLLENELIDRLSPQAAQNTVLIVTADHGQIYTPPQCVVKLHEHRGLQRYLIAPPGGEPRAAYLMVRDGCREAARAYLEKNLADVSSVLDTQVAIEAGLWGPPPYHLELQSRVGDLLFLLRDDYWLADPFDETPLFLGWHGGLSAQEMMVPLLLVDLSHTL